MKDAIEEIRKNLDNEKLILGTERAIKELKVGNVDTIFVTNNAPDDIKADVEAYKGDANVAELAINNQELGVVCKKPFPISVVSLLR